MTIPSPSEEKKIVHLVLIKPKAGLEARRALLKWNKARGIPELSGELRSRQLLKSGMACEIDAEDLDEARTMGEVEII